MTNAPFPTLEGLIQVENYFVAQNPEFELPLAPRVDILRQIVMRIVRTVIQIHNTNSQNGTTTVL